MTTLDRNTVKETKSGPPAVFQIGYAKVDDCFDDFHTMIAGYIEAVNLHLPFVVGVTEKEAAASGLVSKIACGPYFDILTEFRAMDWASPIADDVTIGYATVDDRDEDRPRIDLHIDSPGLAGPLHAWIMPDTPKGKEIWEGERSRFRFWREMPIYWRREQ